MEERKVLLLALLARGFLALLSTDEDMLPAPGFPQRWEERWRLEWPGEGARSVTAVKCAEH